MSRSWPACTILADPAALATRGAPRRRRATRREIGCDIVLLPLRDQRRALRCQFGHMEITRNDRTWPLRRGGSIWPQTYTMASLNIARNPDCQAPKAI